MKKFVICLIGAIILSNCNISCNQAEADDGRVTLYDGYSWEYKYFKGMEYVVFYSDKLSQSSYTGALFAINLTKDALEVEVLRKQAEVLRRQLAK